MNNKILGIWWFTKMAVKVVGEERWDNLRLFRRINAMRFYYVIFNLYNSIVNKYSVKSTLNGQS